MGSHRRVTFAASAALAAFGVAAIASPAIAANRDEARISVEVQDPLGNPWQGRTIVITVDDPALSISVLTNEYGKADVRVPVAVDGSSVSIDSSNTSPAGPAVTVYPGVQPRDRVDLEVTSRILLGGFIQEPQDEEFYQFDADGDGFDDSLWRLQRPGLPDIIAVDFDADGLDVVSDRVGQGEMDLSVIDLDFDGADEVVLRALTGGTTGNVWVYDPATRDEDHFTIGDGSGGLFGWRQVDSVGPLDAIWLPDSERCGVGVIEMVLPEGRVYVDFPDDAIGFPATVDADGDAFADLRCQSYDFDTWSWNIWVWRSSTGAVTTATIPGQSSVPPTILP
jgi:hypothetical protein